MFWQRFNKLFGPPSEPPETYWSAVLGHMFALRPSDIGDLTPHQLMDCVDLIERRRR